MSRRVVSKPGSLGTFAVSEPFWMHGFDGFGVSLASVDCFGTLPVISMGSTYAPVIIVGVSGSTIPCLFGTFTFATCNETNLYFPGSHLNFLFGVFWSFIEIHNGASSKYSSHMEMLLRRVYISCIVLGHETRWMVSIQQPWCQCLPTWILAQTGSPQTCLT